MLASYPKFTTITKFCDASCCSSNLFKAYQAAGYDFGQETENPKPFPIPLDFFRQLGRAKHEPCGEHWNISYGEAEVVN